jgi:membrane carboxypeptidase/penicillin-binding protein PbpC
VLDYAAELGYTTLNEPSRFGLSLALGGGDVKLLEHVGAFATLANDGVRNELSPILKITKPDGSVLEERKETPGVRVFSENVARMITDVLSDNSARSYVFGENNFLTLGDIPVAAKTGTTNDSRDGWTVGYTPALAAGVWVGKNDSTPMKNAGGVRAAGPIWNEFMKEALKGKKIIPFIHPEIPITGKPILDGDVQGIVKVKVDKISGKLATQYTPQEDIEERSFAGFHSILHYIDKDNPLGPAPLDPSRDPQYKNWEEGVRKWVETSGEAASFKKPPTDFDDVHTPENIPKLTVSSPSDNQIITDNSFMIDIEVSATRRIAKVEYYIDDEFRESAGLNPYSRRLYFGNLGDGTHTISIIASDDADNHAKNSISIILQRGIAESPAPSPQKPSVSFIYPENQAIISRGNFPLTVRLFIQKPEFVNRLNVYYNDKNSNPIIIASQTIPITETVSLVWNDLPPSGAYPLYAIIIDKNGESYRSEILVSVN